VPDRPGRFAGVGDALHHLAAWSGGIAFEIRGIALDTYYRDN
jgi:hypothetical protein